MSTPLLVTVTGLVAAYAVVIATAALRGRKPRNESNEPPSGGTSCTIVLRSDNQNPDAFIEHAARAAPPDEVEILLTGGSGASSWETTHEHLQVRTLGEPDGERDRDRSLQSILKVAHGDIVLLPGPQTTPTPEWLSGMRSVSHSETPLVAGPTVIDHNDRFLPRLEALHGIGMMALRAGLSASPLRGRRTCQNIALRPAAFSGSPPTRASVAQGPRSGALTDAEEAALRCSPSDSFDAYFSRLAGLIRRALDAASVPGKATIGGLWVVHSILLFCCVAAVAIPTWRQPTLLALLGKMGADGLLLAPAARRHGERTLLRSFVPAELLLVLAVPFAGVFSTLVSPPATDAPAGPR